MNLMPMGQKVYLVGFSGSGKSHLAPMLARRLRITCYDTDALIEKQTGVTINELFANRGEKQFRHLEAALIEHIASDRRPGAVALGGGAMVTAINRRRVQATGIVVYLSCSFEVLYRRLRATGDRPLLAARRKAGETQVQAVKRRIRQLLDDRRPVYRQADIVVSTSHRTPTETVNEICNRMKLHYA